MLSFSAANYRDFDGDVGENVEVYAEDAGRIQEQANLQKAFLDELQDSDSTGFGMRTGLQPEWSDEDADDGDTRENDGHKRDEIGAQHFEDVRDHIQMRKDSYVTHCEDECEDEDELPKT